MDFASKQSEKTRDGGLFVQGFTRRMFQIWNKAAR
jgi:hypothetical protein